MGQIVGAVLTSIIAEGTVKYMIYRDSSEGYLEKAMGITGFDELLLKEFPKF